MKKIIIPIGLFVFSLVLGAGLNQAFAQTGKTNDSTTPLHLLQPDYPVPYGKTTPGEIKQVLDRVLGYLEQTTPMQLVNKQSKAIVSDLKKVDDNTIFQPGDYRLISYEWGVTYAGMLNAGQVTGDARFTRYTADRLAFIAKVVQAYRPLLKKNPKLQSPVRSVLTPHALDDAGAMAAAMIKAARSGVVKADLRPLIDNYLDYISHQEFRLADGTLARNRPLPNTIWLDDLFMSVPALTQMGLLTGQQQYYDDAVRQVLQFSQRMFNQQKEVYMHGWVQDMDPHPQFHWARANGWAVMTMVELLDALPKGHPGYAPVLTQLRAHVRGLARYQSGQGFWHQLLDRPDSYLETSATAIYTYAIARAINRGWIDQQAYGPMALLAWNAVASKVNSQGQVEGTCVGTGMGFDPAFYYYRPVNVYAAHSYGPVLLAGSEMIRLLQDKKYGINDSAVMFPRSAVPD